MASGDAPAIQAQLVSGEVFNLEQAQKKGPVLIYFWGSWCAICTIVSPAVDALASDASANNYTVLSIAMSSGNHNQILQYQKDNGYHFKTLNDNEGAYSQQWGVKVTPSIFIVNQQGAISYVSTGITSQWGLRIRLWLAEIAGQLS